MTEEQITDDPLPADEEQQAPDRVEVDTPADLEVDDATLDQADEDEDLGEDEGDETEEEDES